MTLQIKETTIQHAHTLGQKLGRRYPMSQASEAIQEAIRRVESAKAEAKKMGLTGKALDAYVAEHSVVNAVVR